MNRNRRMPLSDVTKDYLCSYQDILYTMIGEMTNAPLTDSISHNFIVQMIPHHEAAIDMARSLLRCTTCIPLQTISKQIVAEQTKSIADMKAALCACAAELNAEEAVCRHQTQMEHIFETMFAKMENACADNRLNCHFIRQMIPHHIGAVEMAQATLRYPVCAALCPILQAIITSQKRGICRMRQAARCLSC